MSAFRFFILIVSLSFLAPFFVCASTIDAGDLTWHAGSGRKAVAVVSSDSGVSNLANKALSVHGGFKLSADTNAVFVFTFSKVDERSVRLSIGSGNPRQVQFSKTETGHNLNDAVLKACDRAVQKTLGLPGFFAGKIAFVGDRNGAGREVYTSDLFFQNVSQLTQDSSDVVMPRWSPEGDKLLYTSYHASGFPDIFLIDLKTGKRSLFASYKGTNTGGTFSPTGGQVAMILSSTGNPELFVSDGLGRYPRRMTRIKSLKATPTWSPDGKRIALISDELGGPQLYETNLEGSLWKRIPTNISGYCAEPHWNPKDVSKIIFTVAVNKSFQLALYDFNEKKSRFMTNMSGDCLEARWLKDGRHVIFTHRIKDDHKLWVLDTFTGHKAQITPKNFGQAMLADYVFESR